MESVVGKHAQFVRVMIISSDTILGTKFESLYQIDGLYVLCYHSAAWLLTQTTSARPD
jgi:hypothetical protein